MGCKLREEVLGEQLGRASSFKGHTALNGTSINNYIHFLLWELTKKEEQAAIFLHCFELHQQGVGNKLVSTSLPDQWLKGHQRNVLIPMFQKRLSLGFERE